MKYLQEIIKKNKIWIIIYIILGIGLSFLANYSVSYFQKLIDRFTAGTLTLSGILFYCGLLLILCIASYLDEYPHQKLNNGIYLDLKLMALKKTSRIDYLAYQSLGTGKLIQRIENGSTAGRNILFEFWFRIAKELLLKLLYRMKERMLDNEELLNHYLTRGFMEMVVFRLNRQFSREIHKAERSKDEIVRSKIGISFIHEAFFAAFAALIILIKAALIIYAWYTRSISIGAVVALITLVDNAYTPIAIFNVLFVQYRLDTAAFKRYTSFLDSPEDPQLQNGSAMASFHGNIMVKQLDFTYSGRKILRGLSLTIAPGEKIALAGSSGSGKSTLVKLLAGLLKPDRGQILVDDQELRCVKLDDYYRHIAYIPQESPVFDSTLRENLIFDSTLPDADLIRALEKVQLLKWFQGLEDGLDTQLGERGVRLSGGERQRLALARLWFSDARLIILDESTSAMDNLTEELVMKEVLALADGRNIIAIAHRLNSVRAFDRIILLRNGEIVKDGSFEELAPIC